MNCIATQNKKKKVNLVLRAYSGEGWIGGLYYCRNICFSLLQNKNIVDNCNVFVLTNEDNREFFQKLSNEIKLCCINNFIFRKLWLFWMLIIRRSYCFLQNPEIPFVKNIFWIPDFQHVHYKSFFSSNELLGRDKQFKKIADSRCPLVLSSYDCLKDFRDYFSQEKKDVEVVHFVSYIEDFISNMTDDKMQNTLEKYGLAVVKYACIMNQFWQHKNHKVVFVAIRKYFDLHPHSKLKFVFTGSFDDYRNKNYINELKNYLSANNLDKHIKLLGLIDREEQLILMRCSEYVIQPSLFEGWGTVLEDAKVLDKTVLLSDISVHREQMNEKCKLFVPNDAEQLCSLIEEEEKLTHVDNISKGLADMYVRAKEYSKGFEKILLKGINTDE